LCKSEYSSRVWSKDVKEWWRGKNKLYNIQELSWEFEIFIMHSSEYSLGVGLVSRFIETPIMTHFKALKRILRYIKGTIDFGLFYGYSNSFVLVGYSDSDWAGDMDDRKSTIGFIFYMRDITFTWSSKKQSIVTLSTCEAEYVATTTCVCHSIWLRRLLKE